MTPEQRRIYQAMTPEQKLRTILNLYHSAWELKASGLRAQHPGWTEKEIDEKVKEIFLYAKSS